jgi:hypothetical protein
MMRLPCFRKKYRRRPGSAFRNLTLFFLLLVVSPFTFSQISQPLRFELEHKNSDHEYIVIPMGQQGIALVRDIEKYEKDKKAWEIILLDSALHETLRANTEVEARLNILGHEVRNGNIYLIFGDHESSRVHLTEVLIVDKLIKTHLFKPEVVMQYTQFTVVKNKAIFGGYVAKEPALLLYDLTTEATKIIPGLFQSHTELMDVRPNSNDTFNALFTERLSNSSKKLVLRTYDANGVILVDDVIGVDEGKTIMTAMTNTLEHDELIIMGTWAVGSNKSATGIFSVVVDPFNDQKINFYDFPQLNHFLDYLKPKRAAKIKTRAEHRRSVNKFPEFRVQVMPVRIEETKNGFCFLAEVYDAHNQGPPSRAGNPYAPYYTNNPYGYPMYMRNYGSPYYGTPTSMPYGPSNYPTYLETRMMHASLTFFDNHGNLLADHGLKFPEIKLTSKEQVSDFVFRNDTTVMASKTDKEIIVSKSQADGTAVKEAKIKVALRGDTESSRSESQDNTRIRAWYGRYFFVYGYHTVKSNSENESRDVFYINKVKVD